MFDGVSVLLVFQVILILTKYYHAESTKVLESSLWRYAEGCVGGLGGANFSICRCVWKSIFSMVRGSLTKNGGPLLRWDPNSFFWRGSIITSVTSALACPHGLLLLSVISVHTQTSASRTMNMKKRQERASAACARWCVLGVCVVTRVGVIFSAFAERVHLLVHLEDINQSFRHGV